MLILLANAIPWVNKASLMLYYNNIARMLCAMPWPTWRSEAVYDAVEFISYDWSIKTYYYRGQESVSDSISAIEVPASMWLCMYYIDDLYHIMHHDNYAATGDVVKFSCYITFTCTLILSLVIRHCSFHSWVDMAKYFAHAFHAWIAIATKLP